MRVLEQILFCSQLTAGRLIYTWFGYQLMYASFAFAAIELAQADGHQRGLESNNATFTSSVTWSVVQSTQPSHIDVAFKRRHASPIGFAGVCEDGPFRSGNWALGVDGGDEWVALPMVNIKVWAVSGDGKCNPGLSRLGVALSPEPEFRLHFEGCTNLHIVLAVPLKNVTTTASVKHVALAEFMCKTSEDKCDDMKRRLLAEEEAPAVQPGFSIKKFGPGRCSGKGVVASNGQGAFAIAFEICERQCVNRILSKSGGHDMSLASCKGFAWSENLSTCIIYNGSAIASSDLSTNEGFSCYALAHHQESTKTTGAALASPGPAETAPSGEVSLDLGSLFQLYSKQGPLTGRRTIVRSPTGSRHLDEVQRIVLDERSIYVKPEDWRLIGRMLANSATATALVETAPAAYLAVDIDVERICIRSCDGGLVGPCLGRDSALYQRSFIGALHVASSNIPAGESFHLDGPGSSGFSDIIMDPRYLPWAIALTLVFLISGCCISNRIFVRMRRDAENIPPKYFTVETVALKYEADAGGKEGRNMQPVTSRLLSNPRHESARHVEMTRSTLHPTGSAYGSR
eukprot:TRINITY_DN74985_c0_g1_i1.p1 TRINITY_DN74985_c0_g1~~TRINITY_DN74985_c0_g1_i1.p1  ORF type:complete len:572 (+),score=64.75 TRINITY_DN74985_c0_g1_i1:130-1845(+)